MKPLECKKLSPSSTCKKRLEDQISHAREMVEMLGKKVEKCLEGSVTKQPNESKSVQVCHFVEFPTKNPAQRAKPKMQKGAPA